MKQQEMYVTPAVEIIEIAVEQGFAATSNGGNGSIDIPIGGGGGDDEWA